MEFYKSIAKRSRNIKNIDIDHPKQFTEDLQSKSKNATSNGRDDVNNGEQALQSSPKFICCFVRHHEMLGERMNGCNYIVKIV